MMATNEAEFEQLPDLYQRWVEELLPGGIPREREATCLDCAMCPGQGATVDGGPGYYHPDSKCCTYFPSLPNFLVGPALAGKNPGAAALRNFIENDNHSAAVANLCGVQPNGKMITLYANHHAEIFGRDTSMLCPYAIEGNTPEGPLCGIWKQRNSVCSTWFCKHVRGLTGTAFWHALQGLLSKLEVALSWWAITQLIPDPARAISLSVVDVNTKVGISLRDDAWRLWDGSRESFYVACGEKIANVSAREAIAIAGIGADLQRTELGTRYRELCAVEPPDRLRVAPYKVLQEENDRVTLQSDACLEAFDVPTVLLRVLHYFDGQPTNEAIENIREATRIRLESGLVRRLYNFGILERVVE